MKTVLIRTGSVPVQEMSSPISGSRISYLCRSGSLSSAKASKVISLSRDGYRSKIRRASSEIKISGGFKSFPVVIPEEDRRSHVSRFGSLPAIGIPVEGFQGGGFGNRSNSGEHSGGDDGFGNRRELGEYYERMLKKNPSDSLLLRNYGNYLHEVVGDSARAEECYGRAILLASNGGDGELFSRYGRLIWETQRDEEIAKSYFDLAVSVSPDDCTVLGSYAQFLWEAEEDEDNGGAETEMNVLTPALVAAF